MKNIEEWKDIKEYEGIYQISNFGRIRKISKYVKDGIEYIRNEKLLKGQIREKGYITVTLTKNGKSKHYRVHRLVAIHFIPNPYNYDQVNHLDKNKQNNRVDNLEWCNNEQNCRHGFAKKVKRTDMFTNEIKYYDALSDVKNDGFDMGRVSLCCHGRQDVYKCCYWQFV